MALRCTRIWCVRPVWIATWQRVTPGRWWARVMRVTASRACLARADIFCRLCRVAPDGRVDAPAGLHHAPDERDVFLLDLTVVELARELLMRGVVLRHHHDARRAAVEPMDDARPQLAADAAQIGPCGGAAR